MADPVAGLKMGGHGLLLFVFRNDVADVDRLGCVAGDGALDFEVEPVFEPGLGGRAWDLDGYVGCGEVDGAGRLEPGRKGAARHLKLEFGEDEAPEALGLGFR